MNRKNLRVARMVLASTVALSFAIFLNACSINVKKDAGDQEKKVDIETPIGGLHVSKDVDAKEVGLAVYPGARAKEKEDDGEENKANVNISSSFFGLKVVAIEYESDDSPEKITAFYKEQLKKYGDILECHTSKHGGHVNAEVKSDSDHNDDSKLSCEEGSGNTLELKVGTPSNQRIVSITPEKKGTEFALVLVRTRGKDTI